MELLPKCIFITGTDTNCGKTYAVVELLKHYSALKPRMIAIKPIASGASSKDPLTNGDIAALSKVQGHADGDTINAFLFQPAAAPHILAQHNNTPLNWQIFDRGVNKLLDLQHWQQAFDVCLIEGAGGWRLPLNNQETLDQWVGEHKMRVVLVVGMQLGCINHALLTVDSIQNSGAELIGWVANHVVADMPYVKDNLQSLKELIKAPMLGEIQHNGAYESVTDIKI